MGIKKLEGYENRFVWDGDSGHNWETCECTECYSRREVGNENTNDNRD